MDKLTFAQLGAIVLITITPLLSGIMEELIGLAAAARRSRKNKEDKSDGQ